MPSILMGDVYEDERGVEFLYVLLRQREFSLSISHKVMPTMEQHEFFVRSRPYKEWRIIYLPHGGMQRIGACYLTRHNEIGIQILKEYRQQGYGEAAVQLMMTVNPQVPRFLANINPRNAASLALFRKLGFVDLQVTLQKVAYEPDIRSPGAGLSPPAPGDEDPETRPG